MTHGCTNSYGLQLRGHLTTSFVYFCIKSPINSDGQQAHRLRMLSDNVFWFFFLAFPVTETVELLCPVFIIFHSLFIMLLTFFPTNNYLPW